MTSIPVQANRSTTACTINATTHAITHWKTTTKAAHFAPSSRLIEAIAATHGVYSRQKTSSAAADAVESVAVSSCVLPYMTFKVATTLSFARNPVIRAVVTFHVPKPSGAKTGAIKPAITARMLFPESFTRLKFRPKCCRNQITIEAMKMIVKARWRKSLDFSQRSCSTFFALGIL